MQELKWLEILPGGTLEGGMQLLNDLKWNLQIRKSGEFWFVKTGHQVILRTDSREAADALVYGIAVAFSALPKKALEEFRKFVKESTE